MNFTAECQVEDGKVKCKVKKKRNSKRRQKISDYVSHLVRGHVSEEQGNVSEAVNSKPSTSKNNFSQLIYLNRRKRKKKKNGLCISSKNSQVNNSSQTPVRCNNEMEESNFQMFREAVSLSQLSEKLGEMNLGKLSQSSQCNSVNDEINGSSGNQRKSDSTDNFSLKSEESKKNRKYKFRQHPKRPTLGEANGNEHSAPANVDGHTGKGGKAGKSGQASSEVEQGQTCGKGSTKKSPEPRQNASKKKAASDRKQVAAFRKKDTSFPKYLSKTEMQYYSNFGVILSGVIRINQKNFKEAYISAPDKGMDILIQGILDRNRALEGDEVYYVLKSPEHFRTSSCDGEVQRTAIVVALKTMNHNRIAIGCLQLNETKNSQYLMFLPRDFRIPRIRIRKHNLPPGYASQENDFTNKLFQAQIKTWSDIHYAEGVILQEIGIAGDIEAETSAIMLNYNLDERPYADSLKIGIPDASFTIPKKEIDSRKDLRRECVFTIDPASARDLDDAVSFKRLPNGNCEVGVHIADVTYFLHDRTGLDEAVSKRATTTYLVQKMYPMLPPELCNLCSLNPGEDKLTFSVIWELSPELDIVQSHFTRSVINSCVQFTYDEVQDILDDSENIKISKVHGGHDPRAIADAIISLNKIAIHFRNKRFSNGALRIDQTKITFSLSENGYPMNYYAYVNKDSHRLIEEFMLLGNITVAERINSFFPQIAFLRSHSPPVTYMLRKLQNNMEKHGISLDVSSSMSLHASLVKYHGSDRESIAKMMVLNTLLAKPMARARYYCVNTSSDEDKRHYALNIPLYTHFTSPIRRYADIMVHRLLAASLGYRDAPNWTPDYVQKIAENCNKQKYAAKLAGEKSTELYLSLYMLQLAPLVCEAVVSDVKDRSFDCILLENGSHQRVYYESFDGKSTVNKENGIVQLTVYWSKTKDEEESVQIIQMFSIVKIELKKLTEFKMKAELLKSGPSR